MKQALLIVAIIFFVAGCSSPISKQANQDLAKPISCGNAEGDIRALNAEKSHVSSQMAAGIKAIVPISLVFHVVAGTEGDEAKIATGEYNKMIDKKIAEYKQQCNVQ